ncbi:TonB-dependent receptor [Phenylobacterium soli]|uniref:TonB-dependent receptor n=1 Tax=Phenylobacterium soli TaxID=2170551 RepID=A0A328AJR8_9CAUL|nr:TonB-dependent receptor [Phenylobacterium soli]RAK54839.1 TonB-dependent receptor [Phenylobacterium soli]
MQRSTSLRCALALGASAAAIAAAAPAMAQQRPAAQAASANAIQELVVTAQRREESIQSVPIAVSAFSDENLKQQRIEGGRDLLLAVPNVTFSRANFGGYNFQIRGIGTKLVATSADAAIGVHENNVPLTANNLADADFYDVERVEVLRGPQGTQFGRNTTGGLVNIITAKPTDTFSARITGELGNYNSRKANGYINVPLADWFQVRAAGSYLKRDGYGHNLVTGNDIDGRDLWSSRLSVRMKPSDKFTVDLMWEHFKEDDNRSRVGKQLCIKDPGRTSVGGVPTNLPGRSTQLYLTQGCLPGDLSSPNALQAVNSAATLGGGLGILTGLITGDAYAGKLSDPNLRNIESGFDPMYRAESDIGIVTFDYKLTDALDLTVTGSYAKNDGFSEADYNRTTPTQNFNVTPLSPGGFFNDPQVGRINQFRTIDFTDGVGHQNTLEVRLQSSFGGRFDFSLGASYLRFHAVSDYYVTSNTLTAVSEAFFNAATPSCPLTGSLTSNICEYVDPNPIPDGSGHNYYDNRTRYQIASYAAFGEAYFKLTDDLKLTAGLRWTIDKKTAQPFQPALFTPGVGLLALPIQQVTFREPTGRLNLEWTPTLSFTDKSLVYLSYARGYKGGGFNPPQSAGQHLFPDNYEPEFIDAFELGAKNTLMGGRLILNGTLFHYNYKGYQVSEIIQRTSVNVNVNAKIWGAELEGIWEPVQNLRFNANLGYLHTRLDDSSTLDLMNLTQSDPNYVTIKNGSTFSNCIAPTAQVAALQTLINAGAIPAIAMTGVPGRADIGVCQGAFATGTPLSAVVTVNPLPGIPAKIGGNELPNSPHWTASVGAQYTWELPGGWTATPRADFYYQDKSFARIFNAVNDRLDSYTNTNLSFVVDNPQLGWNVQLFVKNLEDKTVVTDQYQTDDTSGLFTNIFLTEPRTYGISVTKQF